MPPSDFATADIDKVLNELSTDEAILLTAGVGFWYTHSVQRLGIPAIKVFVLHIFCLIDESLARSSSLAMVRMVYEGKTSLWGCLQSVCQ